MSDLQVREALCKVPDDLFGGARVEYLEPVALKEFRELQ